LPREGVKILLVLFLSFLIGLDREEHKSVEGSCSFGGVYLESGSKRHSRNRPYPTQNAILQPVSWFRNVGSYGQRMSVPATPQKGSANIFSGTETSLRHIVIRDSDSTVKV
jgi:hypothetical protein